MKKYPDMLADLVLEFLEVVLVVLTVNTCDKVTVI